MQKYTKLFLQKEAIDDIQQTDIININDNDLYSQGDDPKQFELTNINEKSENNNILYEILNLKLINKYRV